MVMVDDPGMPRCCEVNTAVDWRDDREPCGKAATWRQTQRRPDPHPYTGEDQYRARCLCDGHAEAAMETPGGRESAWQELCAICGEDDDDGCYCRWDAEIPDGL